MTSTVTPAVVEALKPLLKFIYKGEGGYDSYNKGVAGDSPGPYPKGGLQKLTVAQIMDLQKDGKVFAVGAPQFIPSTLKEVILASKTDVTRKFDAETQDALAVWLLIGKKRLALAAYLLGQSSDLEAAQTDLAKEWASIPLPSGFGFYDGDDGGNKATQKVVEVQAALKAGRAAIVAGRMQQAPAVAPPKTGGTTAKPVLFKITALQATFLKKSLKPAKDLPEGEKSAVPLGKVYEVIQVREEIPRDGHQQVDLGGGAGTWTIFAPHWKRTLPTAASPSLKAGSAINWSNFSDRVSPNLTVGEVLQWDSRRKPVSGSAQEQAILRTAMQYEAMRAAWGGSIGVSSFYRPEPINRQVGGVANSQHVPGNAMDVYPTNGAGLDEFFQWIRRRWTGGVGDGRNKGFIHLDTRNSGHFVPGAGRSPAAEWIY